MNDEVRTKAGQEMESWLREPEDYEWGRQVTAAIRSIELESSTLTLDACREHMGCACEGIEGHLAVRGLLPESLS